MKSRWFILCVICIAGTLIGGPAFAQKDVIPKDVTSLLNDISDIDKMRVIGPMKFTSDQLGKMVDVVEKALKNYNDRVAKAVVPTVQDMAKEIRETRTLVLSGKPIPDGFDKKVKKLEADFVEKRTTEDNRTLKAVSDELRTIFTKAQIDTAIKLAKTLPAKVGQELKGTDDQFFNFYVRGTFLQYGGIVTLLEDLKKVVETNP